MKVATFVPLALHNHTAMSVPNQRSLAAQEETGAQLDGGLTLSTALLQTNCDRLITSTAYARISLLDTHLYKLPVAETKVFI